MFVPIIIFTILALLMALAFGVITHHVITDWGLKLWEVTAIFLGLNSAVLFSLYCLYLIVKEVN